METNMEVRDDDDDCRRTLGDLVGEVSATLERRASSGELAELRRAASGLPPAAFWKLWVTLIEPNESLPSEGIERRWATILSSMASGVGLHRRGRGLGEALAAAGVGELRLLKLLRARSDALAAELRTTLHLTLSKGEGLDFADVARLILSDGRVDEERVRRRIARDYFRNQNREQG